MSQTITITLPKTQQQRLTNLAMSYGLSLPEFSRRILTLFSSNMPQESFEEYDNPGDIKMSFNKALEDFHHGRVSDKL